MPTRPYPAWQRRHEAVLQWCLLNPRMKQIDCARETGYSRGQVSRIINSPDFQQELRAAQDIVRAELAKDQAKRLPESQVESDVESNRPSGIE